ncbi:CTP synthase [Candidatus Beckwithbacteria bacterium]|nr:CTP synthase [Candidatus Beckwithbacteria bacterium]
MINAVKKLMSGKTKYIFVSGGVMSGLGKGTTTAALGALLEGSGLKVFPIKVDMYLNIDAGTMNPLEHGETFVTQDGLECDQDIGTYERFLHRDLGRNNYFTAGQVYQSLLNKERQLKYEGACVEAFPHIPLEIIEFIKRHPKDADVVTIEYGGTVGEYQNEAFFEAARMMISVAPEKVCFIHVGYIIQPNSLGELKSKPMQMSIRALNELGIFPDIIVCRSENPIDKPRIAKIAQAAGLSEESVFSCPDVKSIYLLPELLHKQNILRPIFNKFDMGMRRSDIPKWEKLGGSIKTAKKKLNIGLVAKYYASGNYSLEDSYISVIEAIKHAAWQQGVDAQINWFDSDKLEKHPEHIKDLASQDAVIVPQGWGSRGVEGKLQAIQFVREHKIPYLGLCFGMQMASIEFARNVLGMAKANSEEVNPKTPYPIVHLMSEQKKHIKKQNFGGTIRLGAWPCKLQTGSLIESLYKAYNFLPKTGIIQERHRHRYEFNNTYKQQFEKAGLHIVGTSPDGKLVEAIELDQNQHPFFIGTQFHPELISRPFTPHPLFIGLIKAALAK